MKFETKGSTEGAKPKDELLKEIEMSASYSEPSEKFDPMAYKK